MSTAGQVVRGGQWAVELAAYMASQSADTGAWMEQNSRVIKRDLHSLVGLASLQGEYCHLKFYRPKSWIQNLQFRLGRGRGVNSYDRALALGDAGVLVPEPLACLQLGDGMLLVTRGIKNSTDLKSLWLQEQLTSRLQQLMVHTGAVLGALHEAGFSHGDCKWSNFLVKEPDIYLIDLEAVQRDECFSAGCCRDLARFTLNAEDMGLPLEHFRSFLSTYAETLSVDTADVIARLKPRLVQLRKRHLRKYGPRGHRLV